MAISSDIATSSDSASSSVDVSEMASVTESAKATASEGVTESSDFSSPSATIESISTDGSSATDAAVDVTSVDSASASSDVTQASYSTSDVTQPSGATETDISKSSDSTEPTESMYSTRTTEMTEESSDSSATSDIAGTLSTSGISGTSESTIDHSESTSSLSTDTTILSVTASDATTSSDTTLSSISPERSSPSSLSSVSVSYTSAITTSSSSADSSASPTPVSDAIASSESTSATDETVSSSDSSTATLGTSTIDSASKTIDTSSESSSLDSSAATVEITTDKPSSDVSSTILETSSDWLTTDQASTDLTTLTPTQEPTSTPSASTEITASPPVTTTIETTASSKETSDSTEQSTLLTTSRTTVDSSSSSVDGSTESSTKFATSSTDATATSISATAIDKSTTDKSTTDVSITTDASTTDRSITTDKSTTDTSIATDKSTGPITTGESTIPIDTSTIETSTIIKISTEDISGTTETSTVGISATTETSTTDISAATDVSTPDISITAETSTSDTSTVAEESTSMTSITAEISTTDSSSTADTSSTDIISTTEISTPVVSTTITEETSEATDLWSATTEVTDDDLDEKTSSSPSWFTAITKEQTIPKCKPRKRKPACLKSTFGCCPDNATAASGPFGEGCDKLETCMDTKYGCCSDEVSPAQGENEEGCPEPLCESTLFGCCPDRITPAEGEENEGCPEETTIMTTIITTVETTTTSVTTDDDCLLSQFGCCADGVKSASGPDYEGCEDCFGDECTTLYSSTTEFSTMTTDLTASTDATTELTCEISEFGCCPDNETLATGPNNAGCDEANCFNSLYGCCSDNKTFALGPDEQGCPSCLVAQFGCCQDGSAPAHGPNFEGCCLTSAYGCCPDNINPANGPEFEGCSCQYSPYGCCPDNKTTSRGSNYEGCPCEYTPFGCCPDKLTPAQGEKFAGCPCYTFQFGCCPDGLTVIKDPNRYGCDCAHTDFKCCSDEKTPAKGLNFEGCTCATSKYGCCPDGETEAQGDKFEGCSYVIEPPQKACALLPATGPCSNYTVKYYYDTKYGACSRFWYGGCEGNGNRFDNNQQCKVTCEEVTGRNACYLPRAPGPCDGYQHKYYFDSERGICDRFVYGGCLGNGNRFETLEECQSTCAVDESIPPCEQPVERGPCEGDFERWYFDNETETCHPFSYGGCKGNKNNYPTKYACDYHCKAPGTHKARCALARDEGNCHDRVARWYYSESDKKCMPFYYSGCGGNQNRFYSLEECEAQCPLSIAKDTCELPASAGDCYNWALRWYFDTRELTCKQFYYGQCGGNENNFLTEASCLSRCVKKTEPETRPETRPEIPREPSPQPTFDQQICFLPRETGRCKQYSVKWYYDSVLGLCDEFPYGGCEGNQNRFETEEECENNCIQVRQTCTLPPVYGRCTDNSTRWYYDERTDGCYEFQFSGCRGNKNNFFTERECVEFCREPEEDTRPAPSLDTRIDIPEYSICDEPYDPGNCSDWVSSYFFNKTSNRCEMFYYGGCFGNRNRFVNEEECNAQCSQYKDIDVCRQPVDPGRCSNWEIKYYFDQQSGSCRSFRFGGCGGTGNRFASIAECESTCTVTPEPKIVDKQDIDAGQLRTTKPDLCEQYRRECEQLHCPYGVRRSYGDDSCERCECVDPCAEHACPPDSQCSVDITPDRHTGSAFTAVCRQINKPGDCPILSNTSTRCERECYNDANCRAELKCCNDGCGFVCIQPAEKEITTTAAPYRPPTLHPSESPAQLEEKPQTEIDVKTSAGGLAVLRCFATGYPPPTVIWMRGTVIIDTNQGRYVLTSNGDLNIIQVVRSDSGSYVCVADNGLGNPVTREVRLDVTDARPIPVYIVAPYNSTKIATIKQPVLLRCPAGGYPKPGMRWWRGKALLPLKTDHLELMRDFSLLIHSVQLPDLGTYTCEGYGGRGRPKAIHVTLKAYRPPYISNDEYEKYAPFLVELPTTTSVKPTMSYRPTPPPSPTIQTEYPHFIEPETRPIEPVTVTLRVDTGYAYTVGSNIVIDCDVQGYPIPNVLWYKNGIELFTSERSVITKQPHRLSIYGARTDDSGRYRCTASNQYSTSFHEEYVVVDVHEDCKDNPFFANCMLIVKGNYCHNQYYAKFCCRSCTLAGQISGPHPNDV